MQWRMLLYLALKQQTTTPKQLQIGMPTPLLTVQESHLIPINAQQTATGDSDVYLLLMCCII